MRILLLHNSYRLRGGEDEVVNAEVALLRNGDHDVRVEFVSNESIAGFAATVRATLRTPYDADRGKWIAALVDEQRPDIMHVHNFFPLLTPAVHEAASSKEVAVVQTLHNFRLLCANALFLRSGTVCEKCLHGNRIWGVVHGCYRQSRIGSLAVALMQHRAMRRQTWHRHVDRFIALSEFARAKFVQGGLPIERIVVKPNHVVDPGPVSSSRKRRGALFIGRLAPEKGAAVLIAAWRDIPDIVLTIVGDGPQRRTLEASAPANVHFAGQVAPEKVRGYMQDAEALILPSLSYEGFPRTVAEAYATGLPVLSSDIGSLSEIVVSGETGRHFAAGSPTSLANCVVAAFGEAGLLAELGRGARLAYEQHYSSAINLVKLEEVYAAALARRRASSPA